MNIPLNLTLDQLESLQLQKYHGTNKPATLCLPDLRPVDLCVGSRYCKGNPCTFSMKPRPKRKRAKVLVQFPRIIVEQIRNECTCLRSWGWGSKKIRNKCCFRTKRYRQTHKEKAIQTDSFYQEDETADLLLLTNLALSGFPDGLWNWRPGRPNELENWRPVEPNDDTNSTTPKQSTMEGLVEFNGDHSTKENQVLTDSDTAFLGSMSFMDAGVGIGLDNPESVGAAPLDKGFDDLDQLLLDNATKPTDYTFSNFFGSNISNGVLYVVLRNFFEAGSDDGVLDDELGLYSSLCWLRQSSLEQSMLVSVRNEYQINFCFPSLIINAHSIRKHLGTGPGVRIKNKLTWILCEIIQKLFIKIRERQD